jgi:hypothetical protein
VDHEDAGAIDLHSASSFTPNSILALRRIATQLDRVADTAKHSRERHLCEAAKMVAAETRAVIALGHPRFTDDQPIEIEADRPVPFTIWSANDRPVWVETATRGLMVHRLLELERASRLLREPDYVLEVAERIAEVDFPRCLTTPLNPRQLAAFRNIYTPWRIPPN